jgi:spore coat polysaccharide biosynthesis protein SpsF (cytidylyltransferase family)
MATKVLEDWEVKKICWENDVYVIQTPISSKWKKGGQPVRLTIDYQRTYKKGKDIYNQNSKELEDKIDEVYRYLYENNIK